MYTRKSSKHEPADDIPFIIEDFLLDYPEELQESFNRFNKTRQHPQTDPGFTLIEFILRDIKRYAEKILKENKGLFLPSIL